MLKRTVSIMLAFVLIFALAGCSKPVDDGSSVEYEYVKKEIHVSSDGTTSGDNVQTGNNQSGTSTPTASGTSKPSSSTTSTTSGTDYSKNPILANPDDYKGTKIVVALTINPKDDGTDYVVSKFEQEYGIDVDIITFTHENYNTEAVSLIAANKAPTVGISNGDAPLYVGYFQSLDAAKLNYEHPLWNQNTFKLSTYNGSPYLCDTVGNFWTELDIVVYSKSLLAKANCPTPKELDDAGNWNFDSFLTICEKTAQIEGCFGGTIGYYEAGLHTAGGTVYHADSTNHMVNGIDNNTIVAFQKLSQGFKDGHLSVRSSNGLKDSTIAIAFSHAWALRTDGLFADHPNWNDLGFYYMPASEKGGKYVQTGMLRGYGIMKGCNNNPKTGSKAAVAGGLFLSEYLDVSNYDLDRSFISEEAKTFFFKVCDAYANSDNYIPYYTAYDLNSGVSGLDDDRLVYSHIGDDPAQIPAQMASIKSSVQMGVDNLNKFIDQNINGN